MGVDWQAAFNIVAGLAGAGGSFILFSMYDTVKYLRTELEAVKLLVAGNYITRAEHAAAQAERTELLKNMRTEQRETNKQLFEKLEQIAREVREAHR